MSAETLCELTSILQSLSLYTHLLVTLLYVH